MQLKWWTTKQLNRHLDLSRCQGIRGASLVWRLLRRAWPRHNTFCRALCTATGSATLHAEVAGPAPAILALPSRFRSPKNQVNGFNLQFALYSNWFFGGAISEFLCFPSCAMAVIAPAVFTISLHNDRYNYDCTVAGAKPKQALAYPTQDSFLSQMWRTLVA